MPVAEALLGPHVAGERTQATKVATLDHRTFRPIRTRHAEALTLLPETPLQSRAPHYEQARQTGRDFLGCQVLEQLAQSEVQHRTAADIGLTTKAAAGFQRRDQCSDAAR